MFYWALWKCLWAKHTASGWIPSATLRPGNITSSLVEKMEVWRNQRIRSQRWGVTELGFEPRSWNKGYSMDMQRRRWHPTPVLLPGKSHGRRSLMGCSPLGREESDMTGQLHFHFSLSYTGEGNGNLLQCSCLENPRDGGVWWAAVYGVAQSWTRLKQLSSSSSSSNGHEFEQTLEDREGQGSLAVHGVTESDLT